MPWREGNKIQLLENGEQYYPAVFTAIGEHKNASFLKRLSGLRMTSANSCMRHYWQQRNAGLKRKSLLDGYGSPDLSDEFVNELTAAGVVFRYYDPSPFWYFFNVFRRMHRKIVVIDARIAFIGRLNYREHMSTSLRPNRITRYALKGRLLKISSSLNWKICRNKARPDAGGDVITKRKKIASREKRRLLLVWRDNEEHRDDIERHYLKMLTQARREVIIANAYFFPGYRFLHALRKAARRGVRIKLIIQGEPDMPIVRVGARLLYNYLVKRRRSGV